MKAVAALALIAGAQAFMPAAPLAGVKSSSAVTMSAAPESRRAMLQTFAAAAAAAAVAIPELALADGSVSQATVQRAKGIYGGKVLALEDAVKSGNFAAVEAEKNAFTLLSTGGFARSSKADKAKAAELKEGIFAAIAKKDAAALKTLYADFVKLADIPRDLGGETQGYSTDYDWKARTKKGTIYIR